MCKRLRDRQQMMTSATSGVKRKQKDSSKIYFLIAVLVFSIAELSYFDELLGRVKNTNNEEKYEAILHTKISNKSLNKLIDES